METSRSFQKKIRTVRIRCGVGLLLGHTGRVLAGAGVIFALAVLVQQLLAVPVLVPWAVSGLIAAAGALVLTLWLRSQPGRMQACLLLDERLRLHERFSTTLALATSDDPFARAARTESLRAVERVDLRGHFPVSLSRSWCYSAGLWLAAVAILLYMPQQDLLGLMKKKEHLQQQAAQLADAAAQLQETTKPIEVLVQELHDPSLAEELKKLNALPQAGGPQEMKRQAIKALGDLSEKIKQMQDSAQIQSSGMLHQMLRQLHGSSDPFGQQLRMSLAKGNYAQVADSLRQIQSQLGTGSLPDEKRKELASQLQELGKELEKLSQQKRQIEQELERNGLDGKLADVSQQELREAMQKQALSPELIDQLAEKVQAAQEASSSCAGLGNLLGGIGAGGQGVSAEDLSGPIDRLDALESLQSEAVTLQTALDVISRGTIDLGESPGKPEPGDTGGADEGSHGDVFVDAGGKGEGLGDKGDGGDMVRGTGTDVAGGRSQGPSGGANGGGQGEGIGRSSGEHSITSDPLTANRIMRAPTQGQGNATLAGGYFRGEMLVKGEAQRPFAEAIQAGRASAAEAISDNQIPRRYEETIKKYFNQLEGSRR
jgi:hypothetical protein